MICSDLLALLVAATAVGFPLFWHRHAALPTFVRSVVVIPTL